MTVKPVSNRRMQLNPQSPDQVAIHQRVLANLGLAWRVARRVRHVFGPVVELDDLTQEATLGLLRAARYYRPSTGVRFSTYASRCCWHACVVMLRPQLRRAENEQPAIDEHVGPEANPLSGLIYQEMWSVGWPTLSIREREVLLLRYRDGLTHREVGRHYGVGECRARRIEQAALVRLARAIGDFPKN